MSDIKLECFSNQGATTYGDVKPAKVRGSSGATVIDMQQPEPDVCKSRGSVAREQQSNVSSVIDETVSVEPDGGSVASTVQDARTDVTSEPWAMALRLSLTSLFSEQDVEDGISHAAEPCLERALREIPQARVWCERTIMSWDVRWRASLLRVLGRVAQPLALPWGYDVASRALADRDAAVRDAAIRALESWGGTQAIEILRGHEDPLGWINQYARLVVDDLVRP